MKIGSLLCGRKAAGFIAATVAGFAASIASAQSGSPPVMPDIVMPVDMASVVSKISTAGGTIMLLVFGIVIGFALVWKLFRRAKSAV